MKAANYYSNLQHQSLRHPSSFFSGVSRRLVKWRFWLISVGMLLLQLAAAKVHAQAFCAFDQKMAELVANDPSAADALRQSERQIRNYIANHPPNRRDRTLAAYTVPVVIHVMHTGGAVGTIYNPTDAVLTNFINYLNQVFAGTYTGMLAPVEGGGVVNMEITFALAQRTPSCAATNGIDRVNLSGNAAYVAAGVNRSGSSGISDLALKDLARWNSSDYYNIWVVNKIDGADGTSGQFVAGYAYFAGAPANLDGTVMLATQAVAGKSTLPHEIGHAFNLYHTFEGSSLNTSCPANTSCTTQGDQVCDTDPVTNNVNSSGVYDYSCRTGTNPCTGTAFTRNTEQNFMAYTSCSNLFTIGQKTRVQAAMALPSRLSLANSLGAVPCGAVVNFTQGSDTKTESTTGTTLACRKYVDYTYQINIGAAPTATTVATLTYSGTATKGVDYEVTTNGNFSTPSNNLTFPSGSITVQSFTVRVYDDAAVEAAETAIIGFTLNNGGGNASIGTTSATLTIGINDNDAAPTTAFTSTQAIGSLSYNLLQAAGDPLFNSKLQSKRTQIMYKASELTAAGLVAGDVTAMAFYIGVKSSTRAFSNFTIRMGATANTSLYDGSSLQLLSGLTTVKNAHTYTTVQGYNNFTFDAPFSWNGVDNLVVEVCYSNAAADAAQVSDASYGYSDCGANCPTGTFVWQDGISCAGSFSSVNFFSNNIKPTARFTISNTGSPTAVSTALNSTRSAYLGPNDNVYFYDASGNLLARIQNNTAFDYGCTDVTIDRAGTSSAQFWNSTTANYLASKSIRVVPANNTSLGNYNITLYYTPTEVTGWQTATGQTWANSRIVKVNNGFYVPDVTAATPRSSDVMIVTPGTTPGLFGTNYAITGTFSNTGFSGFGVGVPGTAATSAITIPTATIASNNAIAGLARVGNVIAVTFSTSVAPAATPTVTIAGSAATVTGSGTSWSAALTVGAATTEGVVAFNISVQDASSNTVSRTTTTNASSVIIDRTAPTIPTATIASNNAQSASLATTGNTITLSFTTSETPAATPTVTIAGASATVAGSGTNYTASLAVSGTTTEGTVAFSIGIADAAGNTANRTTTTNASSVTVDRTAPTVPTATIASNNAQSAALATTGNTITLTFTTSEAPAATPTVTIAGSSATVTGSGTNYTATLAVSGTTPEGVVAISINIRDAAGNTASRTTTTNASSVTVDRTAPTIPTATIASNNAQSASLATIGNTITLTFTTSETPAATPTVTIAGSSATVTGSGTNYTATLAVSGTTPDGLVAYSVSIRDASGNTANRTTTTDATSVTVNKTGLSIPSTTIASNNALSAARARVGNTITLNFTTSAAPFATPIVTIAGLSATVTGSGTTWSASLPVVSTTTQGLVSFNINIRDAAGNITNGTATTDGSAVTVDRTAPSLQLVSIASNNVSPALANGGNTITLSFTSAEAITTPTVTLAGAAATVSGGPINWTATKTVACTDPAGAVAFSISAYTDLTGNAGTTVNTTTNASSVSISTAPAAAINNNSGTTQLNCAVTSISVIATGGNSYAWTGGATPTTAVNSFTAPGTYTVTVTGQGGCTATASITITRNIVPPTAAITNNSGTTVVACNGSISVTARGGVSYAWSGGLGNNATATINSAGTYTVTVTGANGCTNTASITTTTSNVNTFTGTGNWTDNARWSCGAPPSSNDVIIIESGANCTLNIDFTVLASLTIRPASTFTVASGRTLTIAGNANFNGQRVTFKSDENGTGSLGKVTGSITGADNVTVERYIPNNGFRSWRLLSIPTFGPQTIKAAWQEGNAPLQNSSPGYGTQITGTGSNAAALAAGFDNTSLQPALQRYNGSAWVAVPGTNTAISTEKAYFLFVRGDRTQGITGTTTTATTLRTNGSIYVGDQPGATIAPNSFALVANPFVSAINFTGLSLNGSVKNQFYIWDAKMQAGSSLGAYQTFSATNGFACMLAGGSYVLGEPNTTIQSGQAFFVETGAAAGSVTIPESSKVASSGNLGFRPAIPAASLVKIDTRLYSGTGAQGNNADANVVVFDDAFSADIADEDALKLTNPGENLGIERNNQVLAVEGRPMFPSKDTIQYKIWNLRQASYRLEFAAANMPGLTAVLEDKFLNSRRLIDLFTTTSVPFTTTADPASKAADRFRLIFGHAAPLAMPLISMSANRIAGGVQTYWKLPSDRNIQRYQVQRASDGRNFTTLGTVAALQLATEAAYGFMDAAAPAGMLYYRVKSIGQSGESNYSTIVKVAPGNLQPAFSIAPNPVEGAVANLQFVQQPAGNYAVSIVGSNGQLLATQQLQHAGGNSTQALQLPANLASGTYQVSIIAPDKTKCVQALVVNRKGG